MNDLVVAAQSAGFLTARQALRLGGSYSVLNRLVDSGRLLHPLRHVYLPVDEERDEGPGAADRRHAAVAKGLLSERPDWVASHHTALIMVGLPVWDVERGAVHLAGAQRNSVRRGPVHLHVLRPDDPVVECDGYRILDPGFAALQVAARFGVCAGLVSADAALAAGRVGRDDLLAWEGSGRWVRGARSVRRVVELADARAESPMESVLRLHLTGHGWTLEPQAPVGGGEHGYRADLLVEGRVIVEYDGEDKYRGEDGPGAIMAEKAREAWLRGQGYGFVRVLKGQIAFPTAIRRVVGQAVADHRAHNAVPPRQR